MLKKLYALKNKKGFTLVELMVVVAILGILVAVAVPVYNNVTDRAAQQVDETAARTLQSAVQQIMVMNSGKLESGKTVTDKALVTATTELTEETQLYDGVEMQLVKNFVTEWPTIQSKKYADGKFMMDAKGLVTIVEAGK